jgi:hypothetical protein
MLKWFVGALFTNITYLWNQYHNINLMLWGEKMYPSGCGDYIRNKHLWYVIFYQVVHPKNLEFFK